MTEEAPQQARSARLGAASNKAPADQAGVADLLGGEVAAAPGESLSAAAGKSPAKSPPAAKASAAKSPAKQSSGIPRSQQPTGGDRWAKKSPKADAAAAERNGKLVAGPAAEPVQLRKKPGSAAATVTASAAKASPRPASASKTGRPASSAAAPAGVKPKPSPTSTAAATGSLAKRPTATGRPASTAAAVGSPAKSAGRPASAMHGTASGAARQHVRASTEPAAKASCQPVSSSLSASADSEAKKKLAARSKIGSLTNAEHTPNIQPPRPGVEGAV
uniref:DUF4596 domain-containing protein n=1 Tax=Macrostomum lignano TaxID=282301 RepID=A0A1I8FB06_9PLAT